MIEVASNSKNNIGSKNWILQNKILNLSKASQWYTNTASITQLNIKWSKLRKNLQSEYLISLQLNLNMLFWLLHWLRIQLRLSNGPWRLIIVEILLHKILWRLDLQLSLSFKLKNTKDLSLRVSSCWLLKVMSLKMEKLVKQTLFLAAETYYIAGMTHSIVFWK